MSKAWSVVETKAKLSEILKRAIHEPQMIESRGEPVAVIVSIEEFQQLRDALGQKKPKSLMKDFMALSAKIRGEMDGPLPLPSRKDRKGFEV